MGSFYASPCFSIRGVFWGLLRAIIATFLLAVFAWTPTQGVSEEPTNIHPVSKQECLSSPSSECLIALAIKVAKSQDSPGTLLQEVSETLLQQGQRERARLVLGDAIGLGFDAFSTETGFGANSDLWAVSRLSRLLELLEENGFRDLQLRVVSLLEDFLEREKGSDAQDQALYVLFTAFLELGEFEKAFSATVQTTDPVTKWFRYGDVAVA